MRNKKKNVSESSDEESSSEAESTDSDATVVNRAQKRAPTQKKRGRPPAKTRKQAVQDDSESDASPQPGPSGTSNGPTSPDSDNYESESESESADSDYGPIKDRTKKKQPPSKRKGRPPQRASAKKKKTQVNGVSHLNNSGNQNQVLKNSGNQNQLLKNSINQSQQLIKNSVNQSQLLNNSVNQSQLKPNAAKRKPATEVIFDAKQVESLAQKLVYFLLIEDQKKYAIRRKAITAHVFKDETYSSKLYIAVMKKANFILKKTYGMELLEIEKQKDSYLIVNFLKRELGVNDFVEMSRLKQQQQGLIVYLLTLIFMNDNVITEDELTKSLKQLGIDLTAKKLHPVFGDVKKYITTELVKQMYLNYECISKEPPKYELTWGIRAIQEFDKKDSLQFACQIMDDTTPEDWRIQFKDAENPQTNGST